MLSPKIFHLCQDKFGLSETYQEFHRDPLFYVLCDAIYLSKPEEAAKIAKNFERIIKKYLSIHKYNFNEKTLSNALKNAQKYFFKTYTNHQDLLKVSALVLIQPPHQEGMESKYFYVAAVGDLKLFQLNKPSSLIFCDPEISELPFDLSLKKRFQCVTNAIGQPYIKTSIKRVNLGEIGPLLLMSYGTYSSLSEEKWINFATDFENKKGQLIRAISKSKDKEHLKHLIYISFSEKEVTLPKNKAGLTEKEKNSPYFVLKKSGHFFQWAFKIALVLVLGLCILELTHNFPLLATFSSHHHDLLKNPLKEPDMQLNLHSLKKQIHFPFIKERAFLLDLKNKHDRQAIIIEKLYSKIREQDKALRDLQIKSYYPTSSAITKKNAANLSIETENEETDLFSDPDLK